MISIPVSDSPSTLTPWQSVLRGVPRAYAILFFSPSRPLGWALLVISLLAPDVGLCGLAGVLAAGALAAALGFDRSRIQNGYYLFNPLLVCLTIGWMNRASAFPLPTFLALWVAAVAGGFFIAVALQQWIGQQFGLSAQSLPATAVAFFLYFLAFVVVGPAGLHVTTPNNWLDLPMLPSLVRAFFQTLGSMLFEPRVLPGLCVFAALMTVSPLAILIAASSFAVGVGTMHLLGFSTRPDEVTWCGFNFLLTGIALGSSYFAPSRASLLLALVASFLCALVALAFSSALGRFGLPASALPYNFVVLTLVYALRQRTSTAGLYPSPSPGLLPETAGRLVVLSAARFPHLHLPAIALPLGRECVVTQGFDGPLTHRAPWNHALDLEMMHDGRRSAGSGARLEDYHVFNQPVLAPCDGTVVIVVSHVPDNPPGLNNVEQNWGNHIVLHSDAGFYVLLAHLRQKSALVLPGQRILCGQPLAHCGNSGRSPVPHLHVQVQVAANAGAATRPFCVRHYFEIEARSGPPRYQTSGIPGEGSRFAPPPPWVELYALLSNWLPGEYHYRITRDGGPANEETVVFDFDDAGRFRLRSRSRRASLTGFFVQNVFYLTEYDGPGESVLAFFSVALARVPCIAQPQMTWRDVASSVPFQPRALRRVHELVDPFFGPGLLAYEYTIDSRGPGIRVQAHMCRSESRHVPAAAVRHVVTTLVPHFGIDRVEVRLVNDAVMTIEMLEPSSGHGSAPASARQAAVPAHSIHEIAV